MKFSPASRVFCRRIAFVALLLGLAGSGWGASREVRVGVYANEPKISLAPNQQPTGFLGDLLQEIALRENWTLSSVPCEWSDCLELLKTGRIDLMPDVALSDARQANFDFHVTPALHSWSQIYSQEGARIFSLLDLRDKRLAVLNGSVQQAYLSPLLSSFGLNTRLIPVRTLADGFGAAALREVDAVVSNRFFGELNAPKYGLSGTPIVFQPAQLFFATEKGRNPDLLASIDRHLDEWLARADSPYFRILDRWFGKPSRTRIPETLWWVVGVLATLAALGFAGSLWLRRQVAEQTSHLRASEQKLAAVLDGVDAYIYLKDLNGCYLFANRAVRDLWQVSAMQDVIGYDDEKFFDPATAENIRRNDRRVLVDGETLRAEETNTVPATGQTATYRSTKLPLRREDGSIYALCGISVDITELRRSEANFRAAMTFMPLPIGIATADGKIAFINDAFMATFGYAVSDISSLDDWYPKAYPDETYRAEVIAQWSSDVADAVASGLSTPRREYRIRCKDGTTKRVLITMRPIGANFVTLFEDITERKLNEEELARHRDHLETLVAERTRELADKNAMLQETLSQLRAAQHHLIESSKLASLGELVAGVAHELNTPIGNARTIASTLCEQSVALHRQLQQRALKRSEFNDFLCQVDDGSQLLEKNLQRAVSLIQSFKHVAVDRAGSQRRVFDLRVVTDEVIATMHPTLKKTPFKVELAIDDGIVVDGYPGAYGQVVVNLVDNALAHGLREHAEGTIRLSGQAREGWAEVAVSDDGRGIPEANLHRVFDPFFTTRLGDGGSGLGLNIVYNIVHGLLGGNITVDSKLGQGSCFTIRFPLVAPKPAKPDDEPMLSSA